MSSLADEVIPRHLAPVIAARMRWSPVVVVGGARTCGKSTLLAQCAASEDVPVVDLDDDAIRSLVAQDVLGYLERLPRPVCIDEFQRAVAVLDGIKSELNRGVKPGQYLLTGSTRYTTLPAASQSLTGRAHLMTLWPLSQGELRRHRECFIDAFFDDPDSIVTTRPASSDRAAYEDMVLKGGYPIALALASDLDRRRWFRDLIELVVKRDVIQIRAVRRRAQLFEVANALVAQTAQVLNEAAIASQVGLAASTVGELVNILEAVYVVHRLPAFGRTLGARVGRAAKVHVVDSGLGASLLGVTGRKLRSMNASAMTEFGHLVETFVVNELMKQAGWAEHIVDFYHLRTHDKREVDLVIQSDDGRVIAVEVKAGSKVSDSDFSGMRWLRDRLGDDFVGGVLLNLGKLSYRFDEGLYVMPIETLWRHGTPP